MKKLPAGKKSLKEKMSDPAAVPVQKVSFYKNRVLLRDLVLGVMMDTVIVELDHSMNDERMYISSFKIAPGKIEDEMVECQFDHESIYVQKTIRERSKICPPIAAKPLTMGPNNVPVPPKLELVDGSLRGEVDKISAYFPNYEYVGKGGFGEVRGVTVGNTRLCIKKLVGDKVGTSEMVIATRLAREVRGSGFRDCFAVDQEVYVVLDRYDFKMNGRAILTNFRATSQLSQMELLLDMALSLKEFADCGFVHNDIKLDNFMLASDGRTHLIDYGASTKIGAVDGGVGTSVYRSPRRTEGVSNPLHDVYALAACYLGMLSPLGERVMLVKWGTDDPIDQKTYPRDPNQDPDKLFAKAIPGTLAEKWGPYRPEVTELAQMNLTTLIAKIMLEFDQRMTIHVLVDQLRRIQSNLQAQKSFKRRLLRQVV